MAGKYDDLLEGLTSPSSPSGTGYDDLYSDLLSEEERRRLQYNYRYADPNSVGPVNPADSDSWLGDAARGMGATTLNQLSSGVDWLANRQSPQRPGMDPDAAYVADVLTGGAGLRSLASLLKGEGDELKQSQSASRKAVDADVSALLKLPFKEQALEVATNPTKWAKIGGTVGVESLPAMAALIVAARVNPSILAAGSAALTGVDAYGDTKENLLQTPTEQLNEFPGWKETLAEWGGDEAKAREAYATKIANDSAAIASKIGLATGGAGLTAEATIGKQAKLSLASYLAKTRLGKAGAAVGGGVSGLVREIPGEFIEEAAVPASRQIALGETPFDAFTSREATGSGIVGAIAGGAIGAAPGTVAGFNEGQRILAEAGVKTEEYRPKNTPWPEKKEKPRVRVQPDGTLAPVSTTTQTVQPPQDNAASVTAPVSDTLQMDPEAPASPEAIEGIRQFVQQKEAEIASVQSPVTPPSNSPITENQVLQGKTADGKETTVRVFPSKKNPGTFSVKVETKGGKVERLSGLTEAEVQQTLQRSGVATQAPAAEPAAAPSTARVTTAVPKDDSGFVVRPDGGRVRVESGVRSPQLVKEDQGAVTYEVRGTDDRAESALQMFVSKDGRLVQQHGNDGKAWTPEPGIAVNQVTQLLEQRALTEVGSPERKAIDAQIKEIVTGAPVSPPVESSTTTATPVAQTPEVPAQALPEASTATQQPASMEQESAVPEIDLSAEMEQEEIASRLKDDTVVAEAYKAEVAKGENGSYAPVIAAVAQSPRANEYEKALANKIAPILSNLGTKVSTMGGGGVTGSPTAVGSFWAGDNSARLGSKSPETALHEGVHAATLAVIHDKEVQQANPEVGKAVSDLNSLYDYLSTEFGLNGTGVEEGASPIRKHFVKYGVKNIDEMVAMGMTNREFQQRLSEIKYPGSKKSVWQHFKDILKRMLGLGKIEGTALDRLLDEAGKIIDFAGAQPEQTKAAIGRVAERVNQKRAAKPADMDALTETPEFKRWFGDSKVVDKDGKPLVVYHGTMTDISNAKGPTYLTVSPKYANYYAAGEATGSPLSFDQETFPLGDMTPSQQKAAVADVKRRINEAAKSQLTDSEYAFWNKNQSEYSTFKSMKDLIGDRITPEKKAVMDRMAVLEKRITDSADEQFALNKEFRDTSDKKRVATPNVAPVYASVQNPFYTDSETFIYNAGEDTDLIENLKGEGYDGIIWSPEGKDAPLEGSAKAAYATEILVFSPNQIKSPFNKGTFSDAPDIMESNLDSPKADATPWMRGENQKRDGTFKPLAELPDVKEDGGRRRGIAQMQRALALKLGRNLTAEDNASIVAFMDKFSQFLDDVGISFRRARGTAQGSFDPVKAIVEVYEAALEGDGIKRTVIHEFWHALARYLPPEQVRAIKAEYRRKKAAWKKANPTLAPLMESSNWVLRGPEGVAFLETHKDNPEVMNAVAPVTNDKGDVIGVRLLKTAENYRFFNVDEFFAEEMADRTEAREESKQAKGFLNAIHKLWNELKQLLSRLIGRGQAEKIFRDFMNDRIDPTPKRMRIGDMDGDLESAAVAPKKKQEEAGLKPQETRARTPKTTRTPDLIADATLTEKTIFGRPGKKTKYDNETGKGPSTLEKIAKGLFLAEGTRPERLELVFEDAEAMKMVEMVKAKKALERVKHELGKLKGKGPEAARDLMMTAHSKSESRDAAWAALEKQFPTLYSEFKDMTNALNAWSLRIMQELLDSGRPHSNALLRQLNAMKANYGSYMTRTFLIFTKGKKEHQKKIADTEEGRAIRQRAEEFVKNNHILIPDDLSKVDQKKLDILHDAWVGGRSEVVPEVDRTDTQRAADRAKMIEELERVKAKHIASGKYEQKAATKTTKAVDELLHLVGDGRTAIARFYSEGRSHEDILEQRKDIPKEIRDLWGEITEIEFNVYNTLLKQISLYTELKMQRELYSAGINRYFAPAADSDEHPGFTVPIVGENLGPMNGLMATPRVAAIFNAMSETLEATPDILNTRQGLSEAVKRIRDKVFRLYGIGNRIAKVMTLWGISYPILNSVAIPVQMVANGNLSPKALAKGIAASYGTINAGYRRGKLNPYAENVLRAGLGESAQYGDITEAVYKELEDSFKGKPKDRLTKKLFAGIAEFMGQSDAAGKNATLPSEIDFWKSYYEAKGTPVTEEEALRIAGKILKHTNVGYAKAIPIIKILEQSPLTWFLVFFSEVYRMSFANVGYGMMHMSRGSLTGDKADRMLFNHGAKRFVGGMVAMTLTTEFLTAAVSGALRWWHEDDDDELEKKLREEENTEIIKAALPDFQRHRNLVFQEKLADGSLLFFDAGRLDLTDPATGVFGAVLEGDMDKAWDNLASLWIPNVVALKLINAVKGKPPAMKNQNEEFYNDIMQEWNNTFPGVSNKSVDRGLNVFEIFAPKGVMNPVYAFFGTADEKLQKSSTVQAMDAMGFRHVKYEPAKSITNAARYDYKMLIDDINDDIGRAIRAADDTDAVKDVVTARLISGVAEEHKQFMVMQDQMKAARLVGLDDKTIRAALKDGDVGKERIEAIVKNRFKPTILSDASLKQRKALEIKAAGSDKAKAEKIKAKYKAVEDAIDDFDYKDYLLTEGE